MNNVGADLIQILNRAVDVSYIEERFDKINGVDNSQYYRGKREACRWVADMIKNDSVRADALEIMGIKAKEDSHAE